MRRIKVAAHRGAMLLAPENTIPAYQRAVELGADMIEIDVRTTSDGELVVIHNSSVDGLTDGTGAVSDMTLAEIKALSIAPGFARGYQDARILALSEALRFVRHAGVEVNVEIKRANPAQVVREVVNAGVESETMISSTAHPLLRQVKEICPGVRTLAQGLEIETLTGLLEGLRPDAVNFNRHTLNQPSYNVALAAGVIIYQSILGPYDNQAGALMAVELGADILETNFPGEMVALLEGEGLRP